MEDISIMMVTYNRLELTKLTVTNLIDTLIEQNIKCNLILIDNGSTDGTVEYLQELKSDVFKNIIKVFNKDNKGIAIARNQGLLEADKLNTEWYVTLDNDVLLPKNWLLDSIDILKNNRFFAMIGVNFEDQKYSLVKFGDKEVQLKPKGNLGTACTVFNKSLHKMLGFFNFRDYGKYGLEDSDMGMRIRVTGMKLGYLKDNGNHVGSGENDKGEYRQFKTTTHDSYLGVFNKNCADYFNKTKSLYIPFSELDIK